MSLQGSNKVIIKSYCCFNATHDSPPQMKNVQLKKKKKQSMILMA